MSALLARLTPSQRLAILHQCRLPEETTHPGFFAGFFWGSRISVRLTLNSGFE